MAKRAAKADAETEGKAGRPIGSANRQYDIVEAAETACAKCGSKKRTPYDEKVIRAPQQYTYENPRTKQLYNVVEYRNTQCLGCGQHRRDRTEVLEERTA